MDLAEFALAARSRPAGAAIFAAAMGEVREGRSDRTEVGAALDCYFLWGEADLRVRETVLGGFLVASAGVGVEPGAFLPEADRDGPRAFTVRTIGRGQLELNVRNDLLWLYGRGASVARTHPFPEWDPYRFQVFEGPELTVEHAIAGMISPSGSSDRKLWFYAEYIGQDSLGIGVIDRNVRLGVIGEKLTDAVSFDVDGYWSFMDNGFGGPGVLGLVFFRP